MTRSLALALCSIAAFAAAVPAYGQDTLRAAHPDGAIFRGQIVDSLSGEPVSGVMVRMDVGAEAFTDSRGEFVFSNLPQGRRLFAILSADCRITWGQIDVIVGIPRDKRLRLPPAFGAASEEERREEEERKRTGGKRIEAEEIDRMNARSVTDLIRRVAPAMVSGRSGQAGATSTITSGRNRSFQPTDPPVVVIDGLRIPDPDVVLADMLPSEVEVLEVLPGSAAGWEYGSAGAGGVIKITLRSGLATGLPTRRRVTECVVPQFPGF